MLSRIIGSGTTGAVVATAGGIAGVAGTLALQHIVDQYVQRSWRVRTMVDIVLHFTTENVALLILFHAHCPGATSRALPTFDDNTIPVDSWWRPTVKRTVQLPSYEHQVDPRESSVSATQGRYMTSAFTQLAQYESNRKSSWFHGQTLHEFESDGQPRIKDHRLLFNQIMMMEIIRVFSLSNFDAQIQGLLRLAGFCDAVRGHASPDLKKSRDDINDEEKAARTFNQALMNLSKNFKSIAKKLTEDRDKVLFKTSIEESYGYIAPIQTALIANLTATIFPVETSRKSDINIAGIVKYDEVESDPSIKIEYRHWSNKNAYKAAILSALRASLNYQSLRMGSIEAFLLAQFRAGYNSYLLQSGATDEDRGLFDRSDLSPKQKCLVIIKKALLKNAGWAGVSESREVNAQQAALRIYDLIEVAKKLELFEEIGKIMLSFATLEGEAVIIGAPELVKFFGAHFKAVCQMISNLQANFHALKGPLSTINSTLAGSLSRILLATQEHQPLFDRLEGRALVDYIAGFATSSDALEKCISPGHVQAVKANLQHNLIQLYDYAATMGAPLVVMEELQGFNMELRPAVDEAMSMVVVREQRERRIDPPTLTPQRLAMAAGSTPDRYARVAIDPRWESDDEDESPQYTLIQKLHGFASFQIRGLNLKREATKALRSTAHALISAKSMDLLAEQYLADSLFGLSELSIVDPSKLQHILDQYLRADAAVKLAVEKIIPSIKERSLGMDLFKLPLCQRLEIYALLSRKSLGQVRTEIATTARGSLSVDSVKVLWETYCAKSFEENDSVKAIIAEEMARQERERLERISEKCVANLSVMHATLNAAMSAYVSACPSSGWWHNHGSKGIKRVDEIRKKMPTLGALKGVFAKCMQVANNNVEVAYKLAIQNMHQGVVEEALSDKGNLHNHSLKTYLLTYANWAQEATAASGGLQAWEKDIEGLGSEQIDVRLVHYCGGTSSKDRSHGLRRVSQVFLMQPDTLTDGQDMTRELR